MALLRSLPMKSFRRCWASRASVRCSMTCRGFGWGGVGGWWGGGGQGVGVGVWGSGSQGSRWEEAADQRPLLYNRQRWSVAAAVANTGQRWSVAVATALCRLPP